MKQRAGTRAGVSESVVEMAAESVDPAMWAAIQLTKPDQPAARTVGEVRDRIAAIMESALEMSMRAKWNALDQRLTTLAVAYEQMQRTASDPRAKRERGLQAEVMREAMSVVRQQART